MRPRSVLVPSVATAAAGLAALVALAVLPASAQVHGAAPGGAPAAQPTPGQAPVMPPQPQASPLVPIPGTTVSPPEGPAPDRAYPRGGCRYDEQKLDLIV